MCLEGKLSPGRRLSRTRCQHVVCEAAYLLCFINLSRDSGDVLKCVRFFSTCRHSRRSRGCCCERSLDAQNDKRSCLFTQTDVDGFRFLTTSTAELCSTYCRNTQTLWRRTSHTCCHSSSCLLVAVMLLLHYRCEASHHQEMSVPAV